MTDLRTAVEGLLPCTAYTNGRCLDVDGVTPSWRPCRACAVLTLIPEGSVLVTEAELDAALEDAALDALLDAPHPDLAAAILDRIREGQR